MTHDSGQARHGCGSAPLGCGRESPPGARAWPGCPDVGRDLVVVHRALDLPVAAVQGVVAERWAT
jgi:hypothetical protein